MASEYSPKLRFELIGAGEQAGLWGTTTNKNVGQLIEQAIAGVTTVALDGLSGNYTLSVLDGAPDQSRSAVIKCTQSLVPASGTVNIIIPAQTKLYVFRNDCGQSIVVKTAAQVSGVTLLNGEATLVFCDGTNAVAGIATAGVGPTTVANGGTGNTNFGAGGFIKSPGGTGMLTASSTVSLTADVSNTLPVGNGGTGATTFAAGRLLIGAGGGSPVSTLAGNADGQVCTWSSALGAWTAVSPTSGGVTSFNTRTGPVVPVSSDYSSFYYPLSSNPSGYITSSSIGTMATQNSNNVNITGGSISGVSGVVTQGGTNTFTGSNTHNGTDTFNNNPLFLGGLSSRASNPNPSVWGAFFQSPAGNPAIVMNSQGSASLGLVGVIDGSSALTWAAWFTGNPFSYAQRGSVDWNGSVIVYTGQSDYRLKENVVPLNDAIIKLKALKPVQFTWKEFPDTGNHDGFIAHEFQEVIPDGVTGKKDDLDKDGKVKPQGLDASFAIPVLTKALQEAIARIETLEAEVASLKGA